jgi:hypothetical protein
MNRRLQFVFSILALLFLSVGTSWSQAFSMPCNGDVNISIEDGCDAFISPRTLHSDNALVINQVRIYLKDFGLKSNLTTAQIRSIFTTAVGGNVDIQGSGDLRYVQSIPSTIIPPALHASTIRINTDAITADLTFSGKSFKQLGMWPTKVSVVHLASGNSCWSNVMIEDKLPPAIECPDDVTVSCLVTADAKGNPALSVTGDIDATGSCSDVVKKGYIDEVEDIKCGDDEVNGLIIKRITRTFIVENPKGLQFTCTQQITVLAVDVIEDLLCPEPLVELKCTQGHTPAEIAARRGNDFAYPHVLVFDSFDLAGNEVFTPYPLPPNKAVCNVVATFNDIELAACVENCKGTVKIARTWTILDWCFGESRTCVQVIKKVDDEGPYSIVIGAANNPYSVDAWECDVDITLPNAVVRDSCDPNAAIVLIEGFINIPPDINVPPVPGNEVIIKVEKVGNRWIARDVPYGFHTFVYTASDCCGNTSTAELDIVVLDRVSPVATAKEFITVSLTQSGVDAEPGVAKLFTHQVDNGSYDNCTDVYMEVRREDDAPACLNFGDLTGSPAAPYNNNRTYNDETNGLDQTVGLHLGDSSFDTDGGQFVKFCCEDIGQEVKVWLRVWDDANRNGIFGDTIVLESGLIIADNYNETWTTVKVEDKIVPRITCPAPIFTNCDRDTGVVPVYNFVSVSSFAAGSWVVATAENTPASFLPTAEGVCGEYTFQFKDIGQLNTCNVGTFTRRYQVVGFPTVTCDVTITVDPAEAPSVLEWPIDLHEWSNCELTEDDVNANTVRARSTTPGRADVYGQCEATGTNQWMCWGLTGQALADCRAANATNIENRFTPTTAPLDASLRDQVRFNSNYKNVGCNVFGKKLTIEEYTVGDGCKKWLVRWDYINWCNNSNAGCRQTIYKYEDTIAPVITSCPGDDTDIVKTDCTADIRLSPSATDDGGCDAGLTWRIRIYPFDKTATSGTFVERTTIAPGSFTRLTGTNPTLTLDGSWALPAGEHGVRYLVTDGCGNVTECTNVIAIWPKPATPYCVSLSSAVMKNGLVELWAKDFDQGSFQNCPTGAGYVTINDSVRIENSILFYTFNRAGVAEHPIVTRLHQAHYFTGFGQAVPGDAAAQLAAYNAGNAQRWIPEVDVVARPLLNGQVNPLSRSIYTIKAGGSGMQFGCKIASPSPIGTPFNIEMRVWDVRSFQPGTTQGSDFCRVNLTLVDNQAACGTSGLVVAGAITTSKGDGVTGVETKLMANMPEYPVITNTQNGLFSFASLPAGIEFELSARKNDNHVNGVNTLDLVTIQRHILGIAKLDNAYKYVAADADNNQKINLSDLVELRKLVLGITNELPSNTSWRFVDSKQTFADISNPWPLDEVIVTAANANANNFVAVKVGDVNTDAAVNATSVNLSSRSASAVKFVVEQATINAGEVVSIPVRASNFSEAYGFQMTTELKGLELVSVQSGAITVEEGMVATPKAGVMTMSWTASNGATVSDDAVLFTINVRAKSTVDVSRAIAITSSVTEAVAFVGSDLSSANVELEVRGAGSSAYALGQNEPNPFKAETNIMFTMPEAGEAKFRVVDVTGKVLVNQTIKAAKGENVITLKRADIAATGVVYYQIESGEFAATKKMVIIE